MSKFVQERQSPGFQEQYLVTSQIMARSGRKPENQHPKCSSCSCSGNREVIEREEGVESSKQEGEVTPPLVIRMEGESVTPGEGVLLSHSVSCYGQVGEESKEKQSSWSQEHLLALRKLESAGGRNLTKSPSTGLTKYLTGTLPLLQVPPSFGIHIHTHIFSRQLRKAGVESHTDG